MQREHTRTNRKKKQFKRESVKKKYTKKEHKLMVKIFARKQSVHFINSVENETVQIKTTTTKKKTKLCVRFFKTEKNQFSAVCCCFRRNCQSCCFFNRKLEYILNTKIVFAPPVGKEYIIHETRTQRNCSHTQFCLDQFI